VREWILSLKLPNNEEDIKKISKCEWKKKDKEGIVKVISEKVREKRTMTKLRFIKEFKKQEYVEKCQTVVVKQIMKVRLNMVELKANCRGK